MAPTNPNEGKVPKADLDLIAKERKDQEQRYRETQAAIKEQRDKSK